jgi:hypothetical protein
MSTYRERREARAERLREWADKRAEKAGAAAERASEMGAAIPFGQPILAGHHSQGRDERYRARIAGQMDKAVEHHRKAEEMAGRADSIESQLAGAIYSDDPDAVDQLRARLAVLEAERNRVKAYNASCRTGSPDVSVLDEAQRAQVARLLVVAAWQMKGGAFPSYHLANLSGNIKRNRDRLAKLEAEGH